MKTRVVYEVDTFLNGKYILQRLLPNEFHLIKQMLNEGLIVKEVRKMQYSQNEMKTYFAICI